ncbi:MAG: large subunit ribosomal protein L6 [Myxococcota bacterium]|jgi:large subunit ribosomal protein L6
MSRIGKQPVTIPAGASVTVAKDGATVTVKGPKGQLSRTMPKVQISVEGAVARVATTGTSKEHRACHGLSRALLNNMVIGVTDGHKRALTITGTGYKAEVSGQKLTLNLGFSHQVVHMVAKGINVAVVGKAGTSIELDGADKELLGLVASQIRGYRPPEPYKGKGVAYSDEVIRRKAGKTGK